MATPRVSRLPAETILYPTSRSFDSSVRIEDKRRLGIGGELIGGGRRNVARGQALQGCPVHDLWADDMTSSQTDRSRGLRYTHTTNYPDKILMRRARSVSSLYNDHLSSPAGVKTPAAQTQTPVQTNDCFTQTMVDRYTQTPPSKRYTVAPNEFNNYSYYRQLLSPNGRRSAAPPEADSPPEIKMISAYMTKHGPALYRNGGKGAPWRHLKITSGISGENIMFVDGLVKEYDSRYFPLPSARRPEPEIQTFNGYQSYWPRPQSVAQY